MRIISGTHGGRRISPPAKMPFTRPTTDIAKEGLFNILGHQLEIEGIKTLDLFGGTGCITYELASRGASDCTIVEKDPSMFEFIRKTLTQLQFNQVNPIRMDVFKYIDQCSDTYDLIFAGPPYALTTIDELPLKIREKGLLKPGGWFILEHTPRNNYEKDPQFATVRNYGSTLFSIFVNRVEL